MKSPLLLDWSAIAQSPAAMISSMWPSRLHDGTAEAVRRRCESGGVEYTAAAQASGRNFRTRTTGRLNVDYRFSRTCVMSYNT
jgi:hypothetical protein